MNSGSRESDADGVGCLSLGRCMLKSSRGVLGNNSDSSSNVTLIVLLLLLLLLHYYYDYDYDYDDDDYYY